MMGFQSIKRSSFGVEELLPVIQPRLQSFFFAMKKLLSLLLASLTAVHAQNTTQYVVHNNCPASITLYIGGYVDATIPTGGSVTKLLGRDAGFFYTDANGGFSNGSATRAGFYLEVIFFCFTSDRSIY